MKKSGFWWYLVLNIGFLILESIILIAYFERSMRVHNGGDLIVCFILMPLFGIWSLAFASYSGMRTCKARGKILFPCIAFSAAMIGAMVLFAFFGLFLVGEVLSNELYYAVQFLYTLGIGILATATFNISALATKLLYMQKDNEENKEEQ